MATTTSTVTARGAIPAFINPEAGSADRARAALARDPRFSLQVSPPEQLESEMRRLVASGATRILVSGGDGTIRTAAAAVAGTAVELAIIPGGTLNHFARAHGIPTDLEEAIEVAAGSEVRRVDAAYVNGRLFLNTSSAGAYVRYVRARERIERWVGYYVASLAAAAITLARLQVYTVEIAAAGGTKRYETPIVFVAVGERELGFKERGAPIANGRRGLHVMVARAHRRLSLLRAAVRASFTGRAEARDEGIDEWIVERCRIAFRRPRGHVAVDGELVALTSPLEYSLAREAVTIVTRG
jgi:diacylglycerol kinase family enzyme